MPQVASEALVLRAYKLGETSKVVVLLTRDRGKVRAVARGARGGKPRYQSALEPLSEVRVTLHGRQGAELLRLGQCELVRSAFPSIGRGLDAAMSLSYFAELLDAFALEGEAEDPVYRLALAVLASAGDGGDVALLSRYLEAWLLKLHGLYPSLDRCAGCDGALAGNGLAYHHAAHGFVCDACGPASGPVLAPAARELLREMFRRPPAEMTAGDASMLEAFHRDLIRGHLERDLRSHRVLRDVNREMRG